jgi:hypothetical protein
MKRYLLIVVMAIALPASVHSWGFYSHQWINHIAVYTLPPELFGLFKAHIQTIVVNAVKPDMRRYAVEEEGQRHFIDIDRYEKELPLDTIACSWNEALEKYGLDRLAEDGIVPWHVIRVKYWLTSAFVDRDIDKIIQIAAELGHYIADLHVPLHTTSNYNGQLSGQHGIHGLWESRLPELFMSEYDLFVDSAHYIADLPAYLWKQVEISHSLVDSVLEMERKATELTGEYNKFEYGKKGNNVVRNYSEKFANHYHQRLNSMVERRMRDAIYAIGCIWLTAWVDAGQPELSVNVELSSDLPNVELQTDSLSNRQTMLGRGE